MRTLIGFLSLAVLLMAATPASSDPGVTDTSVKVGMIADLTGPIAFVGQEATAGARIYLQHINEQGGVHGRKIELIVEDDGYQPPRTIAAFRKLVDRDRIFCFVGNIGSPTTVATFPFVKRERIPLILPLSGATPMTTPPKRYVFGWDPSYAMHSWIIVKYIREIQKAPSARLAILYQDD
ncbi:MAG: ABC transporter substrate-binding protein, partial [bacterium]|nr:ABC transporter substrate-binding protein [bacterium]